MMTCTGEKMEYFVYELGLALIEHQLQILEKNVYKCLHACTQRLTPWNTSPFSQQLLSYSRDFLHFIQLRDS